MKNKEYAGCLVRLEKKDISYVRYIFEAYEGVANVTTVDREQSIVKIVAVPDFADLAETILNSLRDEIHFEYV